ncbi:MAG: ATP-grasp domain-containing protein [Steroidobacteraceae bacterium]
MLVTNGDTRPALAITRSLGRQGHEVIVAAERHPSLASASRFCAGRETYPAPDRGGEAFSQAIASIVARRQIGMLLPVTEIVTMLIAEHRELLPAGCVLPLPLTDSLRIANDKSKVLALAVELGIPVPRTVTIASRAETADPAGMNYPIVIKPARSRVQTASGWLSAGVDYAADADELRRKLESLPAELFPVLLQERIVGPGVGVFACYQEGRRVALFSHRRLREKPPSGGVSVLCESVPLDVAASAHAQLLLSRLHWHGVAMVEFKRDNRDGSLQLMEINGRFWGSLQLAIDAGVDFPAIVARLAQGESVVPVEDYQVGVISRWFLGDLDALLALWKHGRSRLQLPDSHPGRWRTLHDFLRFWRSGQRGEVLRLSDPCPGLFEIQHWLRGR